MGKHRVTTRFRNRFGVRRTDVRIIEVATRDELPARVNEIIREVDSRPGCEANGATSEPI